jgi:hypothetical protein
LCSMFLCLFSCFEFSFCRIFGDAFFFATKTHFTL